MEPCDLALILALDCSASVRFAQFTLMTQGTAAALRDPEVASGLTGGPLGATLAAVLLWSGPDAQEVLVEWTRLATGPQVIEFAQLVEDVPRTTKAGLTAIGSALAACASLLAGAPVACRRQVIDLVGDGRSNSGVPPQLVRDRLVAAGVTINGLCVLHEERDLVQSYTEEVIGGPGSFALPCQDFNGFAEAMRQKLKREIV